MAETNVRTFADNWYGTGSTDGAGDAEDLVLEAGQYMISEVVAIECVVELAQNVYESGDEAALSYRTGATEGACLDSGWTAYTEPFASLGYVQVMAESTL